MRKPDLVHCRGCQSWKRRAEFERRKTKRNDLGVIGLCRDCVAKGRK